MGCAPTPPSWQGPAPSGRASSEGPRHRAGGLRAEGRAGPRTGRAGRAGRRRRYSTQVSSRILFTAEPSASGSGAGRSRPSVGPKSARPSSWSPGS